MTQPQTAPYTLASITGTCSTGNYTINLPDIPPTLSDSAKRRLAAKYAQIAEGATLLSGLEIPIAVTDPDVPFTRTHLLVALGILAIPVLIGVGVVASAAVPAVLGALTASAAGTAGSGAGLVSIAAYFGGAVGVGGVGIFAGTGSAITLSLTVGAGAIAGVTATVTTAALVAGAAVSLDPGVPVVGQGDVIATFQGTGGLIGIRDQANHFRLNINDLDGIDEFSSAGIRATARTNLFNLQRILTTQIGAICSEITRDIELANQIIRSAPAPGTSQPIVRGPCDDPSVVLLYGGYTNAGGTLSCTDWDAAGRPSGPPTNDPPTSVLRLSKDVADGGEEVPFTLNYRDPDGDTVTEQISVTGGTVERGLFGLFERTWTMPAAQATDRQYTITASVSDGFNPAVVRSQTITVRAAEETNPEPATNQPPTVSLMADRTLLLPGESATITATANDPDGPNSSITYRWQRDGTTVAGQTGTSVTVPRSQVGRWTCVVTDQAGATASASITIAATLPPNQPPTVSVSPTNPSVAYGESVRLQATASDPDGDPLEYEWFIGNEAQMNSASNFLVSNDEQLMADEDVTISCRVNDPRGAIATDSVTVRLLKAPPPPTTPNRPPTGNLLPNPKTVDGSGTSIITLTTSDPDADTVTAEWLTTGGTLSGSNADRSRTWTAPPAQNSDVVYTVQVTLSDGVLTTIVSTELIVTGTGMVQVEPCEQDSTVEGFEAYIDRGNSVYGNCEEWVAGGRPLNDPVTTPVQPTSPTETAPPGVCSRETPEGLENADDFTAYVVSYVGTIGRAPSFTCETWVAAGKPSAPAQLGAATNITSYIDHTFDDPNEDIIGIGGVTIVDQTVGVITNERAIVAASYEIVGTRTIRLLIEWDPVGNYDANTGYFYSYQITATVLHRDEEKIRDIRIQSSISYVGNRPQNFPPWVPGASDEVSRAVLDAQESYVRRFSTAPEIITLPLYWHHPPQPDDVNLAIAADVEPGKVYDIHIPASFNNRSINERALCVATFYLGDSPGSDVKLAQFLRLASVAGREEEPAYLLADDNTIISTDDDTLLRTR